MRQPFSIKWIYLIERRSFDQTYKFSNKNDIVCEWRKKNPCGISTYDKWNFKPQILYIFHLDRASDGRMAHILSVNVKASALKSFLKEENDSMRKMSGNRVPIIFK